MITFSIVVNFCFDPLFDVINCFLIEKTHSHYVFVFSTHEVLSNVFYVFIQCGHLIFSSNPFQLTISFSFLEFTSSFSLKISTTTLDEGYRCANRWLLDQALQSKSLLPKHDMIINSFIRNLTSPLMDVPLYSHAPLPQSHLIKPWSFSNQVQLQVCFHWLPFLCLSQLIPPPWTLVFLRLTTLMKMTHPQLFWWIQLWVQKVKILEGQGVGACSLVRNTLGVEGHIGAPKWGLGKMTRKSITHMDLHKLNNKLVSAWCMDEPHANTLS
jgi:hypothetical protein